MSTLFKIILTAFLLDETGNLNDVIKRKPNFSLMTQPNMIVSD